MSFLLWLLFEADCWYALMLLVLFSFTFYVVYVGGDAIAVCIDSNCRLCWLCLCTLLMALLHALILSCSNIVVLLPLFLWQLYDFCQWCFCCIVLLFFMLLLFYYVAFVVCCWFVVVYCLMLVCTLYMLLFDYEVGFCFNVELFQQVCAILKIQFFLEIFEICFSTRFYWNLRN